MAAYKTFLKENDSQNWLKSTLALRITRDGLLDLAEDVSSRTQQLICLQILSARHLTSKQCGSCRTPNILPCPTRGLCSHSRNCKYHNSISKMYRPCPMEICDTFRDEICVLHRLCRPSWRNTRAELWCRNHFEVAKCFMGEGFHDATSFVDVDLNGVLGLMLNCKAYARYFSFPMTDQNILTEIRDIWQYVRHSPDLKVSDELFEMCMVKCKALLEDSKWLSTNPAAKAAVEKLNKLMTDEMPELEQEESKFALAQAAEIVTEVQDLIDVTLGGETKRPIFSNEAENTEDTLKYIKTNLKRIQKVMKKESPGDDIHRGATSTDSGYGTCSMKSSVYPDSEDDVLSFVSDVNFTEEQNEIFQLKMEQWQTADIDFKDTGTMTELMNKDVATMTEHRDDTSLADSMKSDLSGACVNTVMDGIHIYTVEEALTKEPESIINLAVQVIKREVVQSYTNNDNIRRSYFPCLVADRTGIVWLRVYQEHERTNFEAQTTVLLRGLLKKTCEHPLWCVSTTELTEWEHFEIPHNIIDAAIKSSQPSSPPIRSLKEAVAAQTSSTVVGKVVQASTLKRGVYGGLPTRFLYLVESNDNPPVKTALHGIDAQSEFTRGDVIRVTGAYPCNKGQSLSTTEQAKVEFLPRDHIDVVIDAIPDSQDSDFLADNVSTEDFELMKVQSETNAWNQSFLYGKGYIRSLIRKCLPPPDILDDLCYCYGRKSKIVRELCGVVLVHIKEKVEALSECLDIVADIYPSYTLETEHHIVFLVTLKRAVDKTLLKENISFATEYRVLGCYTTEAESIYKSEFIEPMSEREQLKAKRCINMHSEKLFKKHRYLSIITANIQKSRGFKTNRHVQDKKLCIVLFVHAKGFIPIDEDSFSDAYDEIAIDVLEGVFIPYGKTCTEFHDDVKMGCKIVRSTIGGGTLGGFIDHHQHGLVGLSCAHALLDKKELENCQKHRANLGLGDWPVEYRDKEKRRVYQPEEHAIHNRDPLGHIVEAVYSPGGGNQSGIDAVLFRVENRFPQSGGFPFVLRDGGYRYPTFSFGSGRTCGPTAFCDKEVAKFGASTELTTGYVEFEQPFLCVKTIDFKWMVGDFQVMLYNQYQVRASPESRVFANPGDSGALVFVKDLRQDTVCIGIVEGGEVNSQITAVSPIADVLERFNTRNFKQFENEDHEKRMVRMEKKIDDLFAVVNQLAQK